MEASAKGDVLAAATSFGKGYGDASKEHEGEVW